MKRPPLVDLRLLAEQRAALQSAMIPHRRSVRPIVPPRDCSCSHPSILLRDRKVGCVVMAGGQATRLGNTLPKGVIPFSPVAHKPLLQLLVERAKAYGRCYGFEPHLAIMTSEVSDLAIRALFEEHHFFDLEHVSFFSQPSLPLLDMNGQLISRDDGSILTGPDGNGSVFSSLSRSGILKQWAADGVEAVSLVLVDNPLLDPFCPCLLSPIFAGVDLTAAAVKRSSVDEAVGLFVADNDLLRVIEYSEIDPSEARRYDDRGHLVFCWANISFFCCSLPFLTAAADIKLPLHMARKKVEGHDVWKAEYFVFDAMAAARSITLISLDRELSFAPVKDRASFEAARLAMMRKDRQRFFELTGLDADASAPFELPASAWYPTEAFVTYLRRCGVRRGFVEDLSAAAS